MFPLFKNSLIKIILLVLSFCYGFTSYSEEKNELMEKYNDYRDRFFSEFILISPNVEQFGVNLPAIDRRLNNKGEPTWLSWSDGNSNYNQLLGFLITEYRLLKNNNQDYSETVSLLFFVMLALERLDLYSEYLLRKHHDKYLVYNNDTLYDYILLPDDINGFLLRDDVSLGFWKQYHKHFNSKFGVVNDRKDGTHTYRSVFQKGKIFKQGMSQDNIFYLMQSLAMINKLAEPECIRHIEVNYINDIIPNYLAEKQIVSNDSVYFDRWAQDITDRLIQHIRQEYPKPELCIKPFVNKWRGRPTINNIFSIFCTRWYIMNPVNDTIVREGSGEDLGVMVNSYGAVEAANTITGNNYHYDNSECCLSKYLFKSFVFKSFRFLNIGGVPIPEQLNDYMFRALASISDVNFREDSYELIHLLRNKRKVKTYEHDPLILYILHEDKYSKIYHPGASYYEEDKVFYEKMLGFAPSGGTSTDTTLFDYHPYWTSSSRLTWPRNEGRRTPYVVNYAGMDYLYLFNLYKLTFDDDDYYLRENRVKPIEEKFYDNYPKPEFVNDYEFNYLPPRITYIHHHN